MPDPWRKLASELRGDYRVFRIRQETLEDPRHGTAHHFYVIEAPDWVNVVAVTEDDQVVLVRQQRQGIGAATLEIPGGMIDPGESPLEAARRELEEETGYRADDWRPIGCVRPNPALQSNACTTFLALGARKVAEPKLDGTEDIVVELARRNELHELVAGGEIDHALVVSAFYWLDRSEWGPGSHDLPR